LGGSVGSSQGGLTETLAEVRDSGGSLFLVVQLFFLHCEALEKGGRQDELNDNSPNESERTNCEANQVLFPGKGHSSESTATELGDADLDGEVSTVMKRKIQLLKNPANTLKSLAPSLRALIWLNNCMNTKDWNTMV